MDVEMRMNKRSDQVLQEGRGARAYAFCIRWRWLLFIGALLSVAVNPGGSVSTIVSGVLCMAMLVASCIGFIGHSKRPAEQKPDKKSAYRQERMMEYRALLLQQIDAKAIIDEEMGNDRYLALTGDTVYFVSIGISSGAFFGKKVKAFSIEDITSVDVSKKLLASYLEITAAGMGGDSSATAYYTERNENRVFFPNEKYSRFQSIAEKIRALKRALKNGRHG